MENQIPLRLDEPTIQSASRTPTHEPDREMGLLPNDSWDELVKKKLEYTRLRKTDLQQHKGSWIMQ